MIEFDPPERTGLDFLGPDEAIPTRLQSLLSANLEEHKGDYAILADILEALIRYRHLIRSAFDEGTRRLLMESELELVEHLEAMTSARLRDASYSLSDELRAL